MIDVSASSILVICDECGWQEFGVRNIDVDRYTAVKPFRLALSRHRNANHKGSTFKPPTKAETRAASAIQRAKAAEANRRRIKRERQQQRFNAIVADALALAEQCRNRAMS